MGISSKNIFFYNYWAVRRCGADGRVTASQAVVSSLIPVGLKFIIKKILPGTRSVNGAEPQSPVSVSNISGLNLKSHRSACYVEAYVPLIAIRPLNGDVKPGCSLCIVLYCIVLTGGSLLPNALRPF